MPLAKELCQLFLGVKWFSKTSVHQIHMETAAGITHRALFLTGQWNYFHQARVMIEV